jgi:hypothetical protein
LYSNDFTVDGSCVPILDATLSVDKISYLKTVGSTLEDLYNIINNGEFFTFGSYHLSGPCKVTPSIIKTVVFGDISMIDLNVPSLNTITNMVQVDTQKVGEYTI